MTLAAGQHSLAALWAGLQASPSTPFLDTPGGTLSRAELSRLVRGLCARFRAAGLAEGDRVLILCVDEPATIAGFVAALLDGLVPVMVTPDTPAPRAASIAAAVQPAAVLCSAARAEEGWAQAAPLRLSPAPPANRSRWSFGTSKLAQRVGEALGLDRDAVTEPRCPAGPAALAYILFTSGTTQAPSGVMLSRRALLANVATIARVLQVGAQSRVFNDMVLAHADGLVQGPLLALGTGACVIRTGSFSVQAIETWLDRVRSAGATHFVTVPTVWRLIDQFAQHDDYFAHEGFTHLSSVAASLDLALWERLESRFGHPLTNQYGLTETVTSALYAGPHPEAGAVGTIGRPVDCRARIAPERGEDGVGELQLQGDNIFTGYWQDDARTAASFTPDGWLRTGDLARAREDGSFEIVGRLKTVIMSGGFLIRPEEIDEAMRAHPAVVDSVTVGLPNGHFDEVPMTAVVLKAGAAPVSPVELVAHARDRLEALKVPRRIVVLPDLPRGAAGKPQLGAVRDALQAAEAGNAAASRVAASAAAAQGAAGTATLQDAVLDVAAEVFRVDRASLSLASTPDEVPGWDSFAQVELLFELEKRVGVRIPAARAVTIRSLGRAAEVVAGLAA